jgi:hypothetical protein
LERFKSNYNIIHESVAIFNPAVVTAWSAAGLIIATQNWKGLTRWSVVALSVAV